VDDSGFGMRVIVALFLLAASLSVGGCSRPWPEAYALPLPLSVPQHTKASRIKKTPPHVRKRPIVAEASPVKPPSVRKPPEPSKILSVKSPPVTKPPEPTKVPSANPPALPLRKPLPTQSPTLPSGGPSASEQSVKSPPVRKPPEPTKVLSANPPALPLRKPVPTQSPTPPSGGPSASEQSSEPGVGQGAEAKFKAAQAKAKLHGVHTLTQKDIEGLSYEQIKELRGY
jgi:hypothetical protein